MRSVARRCLSRAVGPVLTACVATVVLHSAVGCARQEKSIPVAVKSPVDQARAILEQFAAAGETDSSIVTLRELVEAIASKDASKAGLVKECDALMSAQGREQVKAKVEAMLGLLR